jgi:hypothetical protein
MQDTEYEGGAPTDIFRQGAEIMRQGTEFIRQGSDIIRQGSEAVHQLVPEVKNAYHEISSVFKGKDEEQMARHFMDKISQFPTKTGGNDGMITELIEASNSDSETKSFYDDLRRRIALYNQLKDNVFIFYANKTRYEDLFKKVSNEILGLNSIKDISLDEFKKRWDAMDKETLKGILMYKRIKFELDVMALELDFQKNLDYDTVKMCVEYQELKCNAIKKKFDFTDII